MEGPAKISGPFCSYAGTMRVSSHLLGGETECGFPLIVVRIRELASITGLT